MPDTAPPTAHRTAADLVEEGLRHLLAHDMAAFTDLWAEDGAMEFPFAAPGAPRRLEGRAEIRSHLLGYNDVLLPRSVPVLTLHRTADPDVVVAEMEVEGEAVASGRPYRLAYVAVITARDGKIALYRDYWSPLAGAEVLGGLDAVAAGFGDSDPQPSGTDGAGAADTANTPKAVR